MLGRSGQKGRCFVLATEEEKALLRPPKGGCERPDEGERRKTAQLLQNLVIGRLSEAFVTRGELVPQALGKGTLPATALSA